MTAQPRRAGRPGAISAVGLTGAPNTAAPVAPAPAFSAAPPATPTTPAQEAKPQAEAAVTPRRRDVMPSQKPKPRPVPAPKAGAETTVSYTVRFDVAESDAADVLTIKMRRAAGRRTLDRSEMIRTLLRLAATDEAVRAALLRELMTS